MTAQWLSPEEQLMWRGYLDSTRLLLRNLDRQLTADAGISLADFEILALLSEAPGQRLRMSELAEITVTTRSGVTRAVKRLIDAGWVHQVKCEEDKRGQFAERVRTGLGHAREGHRRIDVNGLDLASQVVAQEPGRHHRGRAVHAVQRQAEAAASFHSAKPSWATYTGPW